MADTLAPGFLVAAPSLRDPAFERAVVLLVEHGADGSIGFIINRPAPVRFGQVAEVLDLESADGADERTRVFLGGPVASQSGWILFDPRNMPDVSGDAVMVTDRLAVSASRRLLKTIAEDTGPRRHLLALGYAGWSAGQLDGEFSRGVWLPVGLDDEVVFDVPAADRWRAALLSAGIDPARMMLGGFSA